MSVKGEPAHILLGNFISVSTYETENKHWIILYKCFMAVNFYSSTTV